MQGQDGQTAILVTSALGRESRAELERQAVAGERPRKDYVELARALDADVIDGPYMAERATPLAQLAAHRVRFSTGQITEAFLRHGRYRHIVAWGDQLGLPLALLFKLARARHDLVLIAQWTSRPRKAVFLRNLKAHNHLRALVYHSSVQLEIAASRLGVPRHKLRLAFQPVDEHFWRPAPAATANLICSVGVEARDYPTLLEAVRDLDVAVELGVASTKLSGPAAARTVGFTDETLPANVGLSNPSLQELRSLYSRSRFVVLPLRERDYDAGATVVTEAMAMGKAVILTRTRGQVDLVRDKEQGLYVPPGDPRALRAAIEYLLDHPDEAERMGQAGRALIEERHTLDAYVAHLAALIRGVDLPKSHLVEVPTNA